MHKLLRLLTSALIFFTIGTTPAFAAVFGQNQVTTGPYGGLVISTSTSATKKLGQLKGTAYGDIIFWDGSTWGNHATGTLGISSGGGSSASSTALSDNNTWSGTNVFSLAPIFSSLTGVLIGHGSTVITAASTQTCTNQFFRSLSGLYAVTCATVSLTADVTGVLPIANGGTNASSYTQSGGILAYDGTRAVNFAGYTLTTALLTATNASTTNEAVSQSLFVASKQVNPYQNATFAYGATSTAWTGTTTETTLIAPFAGTLQDVQCVTSAGTLNVQAKVNSTSVTPMFNASTTKGTVTYTANNTFVRGDTLEFDFGTPASSPTSITCTPRAIVTSF